MPRRSTGAVCQMAEPRHNEAFSSNVSRPSNEETFDGAVMWSFRECSRGNVAVVSALVAGRGAHRFGSRWLGG